MSTPEEQYAGLAEELKGPWLAAFEGDIGQELASRLLALGRGATAEQDAFSRGKRTEYGELLLASQGRSSVSESERAGFLSDPDEQLKARRRISILFNFFRF